MSKKRQPIKIFVAAPWVCRDQADAHAGTFRTWGHEIVSTWHRGEIIEDPRDAAAQDLADLAKADVLVLLSCPVVREVSATGGKHVELGIAMASGMDVFVWGDPENVYHHHPLVTVCGTSGDLRRALAKADHKTPPPVKMTALDVLTQTRHELSEWFDSGVVIGITHDTKGDVFESRTWGSSMATAAAMKILSEHANEGTRDAEEAEAE